MDASKNASGGAFLDAARRASASISVVRQSVDFSLSTSTTTALAISSSGSNVAKSLPSRCSPPPSYLLDDDPFANLTPMTIGNKHRSHSVGSTSSCIPRSQRPPPIHPELVPGLSLPVMSVGLQPPKSRLQESLDAGTHEGNIRRAKSQNGQKEETGKKEGSSRKRAKTFFVAMSAPVSPSKSHFASKTPIPPLPRKFFRFYLYIKVLTSPLAGSETMSLPSSPNLPMFGTPSPTNSFATIRMQPRPAHQRPAFVARPSLPSLDALAKANVVLTKKVSLHTLVLLSTSNPCYQVRKGHVGAGLPFEPWDNLPEDDQQFKTSHTQANPPTSDIDRTPTSTPVSITPASLTRPSSSSTLSTATSTMSILVTSPPPQPLLPSQLLGPLIEDPEMDTAAPLSWSPPPLAPSAFGADVESVGIAAPVPLLPSLPESSVVKSLEAETENFRHGDTDSEHHDEENGYFDGDLLDAYGISRTPEPELHDSQHERTNEVDDRSDDPEALDNKLRWSVDTYDSNAESQSQSPRSNSYAGSVSDLSSGPSYPPSYSFGYGWSNSDRDSMTDVSRDLSLSRSISSTSISTSSIGDDVESDINLFGLGDRFANISDRSQGTEHVYDHYRSSTLIVLSDSPNNSILHSPDSEWTSLTQQRLHSTHLPDILLGPALKRVVANSAADHQTEQVDSEPDNEMPITSPLQNSGQSETEDIGSHAVAHDEEIKSPATAVDLFSTDSAFVAPNPDGVSSLHRNRESRLSFLEDFVEPALCSLDSSQESIFAEPVLSKTLSNFSEHLHPETERDDIHEMNGLDRRLREKMTHSLERDHSHSRRPSAVSSNFGSSHRRSSKLSEEEERRRRILLHMQRGQTPGEEIPSTSTSRSISRTPSSFMSSPNPQQFASAPTSSTSDEEEISSDDDVPLAQRIPGALTAQQTIRKQVKEERDARSAARKKRQRERQATLRPVGAGLGVDLTSAMLSSLQDAALYTSDASMGASPGRRQTGSVHHQKAQVIPSMPLATRSNLDQAFKPEDLARKLQTVKMMNESPNVSLSAAASSMLFQHQQSHAQLNKLSRSVSGNSRPFLDYYSQHASPVSSSISPIPKLTTKRSFHGPELEHRSRDAVSPHAHLPLHKRSMSMGRGDRERSSRRGYEDAVPPLPNTTLRARTSSDDHRDGGRRVLVKPQVGSKVSSPHDLERLQQEPPVGEAEGVITSGHRIFVHSTQHSRLVDIRPDTSAGDLITSLETEGALDGWAGVGGWMVWEVAQDFGMGKRDFYHMSISDL